MLLLFLTVALAAGAIRFEDVTPRSGLRFELRNSASGNFHSIELMPAGVAALDFDNDGRTDLYFINGAAIPGLRKTGPEFHNRLFRNQGDGTFRDVTAQAGVAGEGYAMAVATADFDNDGFTDIFVAGVNRNVLYRNLGNGRFADVTQAAGLTGSDPKEGKMWAISAGWFDYDNDGWLDLFISNYVAWDPVTEAQCTPPDQRYYCHPNAYRGLPNQLFRNLGDGTFRDVSAATGIARHIGKGMGVAFADFDGDGFTDVFVANDSVRSFLFHNERGRTFREIGLEAGVALREDGAAIAGMGADFRDLDNDGQPDLIVSGMINDSFLLFRNLGRRLLFEDWALRAGLLMVTRPLTGWGLGAYDFDNDGWKDLFFSLSHFPRLERYLGREPALASRVFRNLGGQRFRDEGEAAGLSGAAQHRGVAFADFDNDGRVDAAVAVLNGPARLFRNVTEPGGHWLALRLRGRQNNRQGLGAVVKATLPDGSVQYNHATTSVGYASSSEPLVRFGLGTHQRVARLEIRWPGGRVQEMTDVPADRILDVGEELK